MTTRMTAQLAAGRAGAGQHVDELQIPRQSRTEQVGPADAEAATHAVAAAVWAPSIHNTQPWWFTVHGPAISLYADMGRQLSVADSSGREMLMSCGAALFTARLALRSLGYVPETRILPDASQPWLVARVGWSRWAAPSEYEQRLFSQVLTRRTHRGGFDPLPLSSRLLAALDQAAARHECSLRVIADDSDRALLAAAVQRAEQTLEADSSYIQELASWVSPPGSPRRDGVPYTAYPARPEHTYPDFPGRDFAHGLHWGLPRFGSPAASRYAGVVCVLTTPADNPHDWVNAGQALQRVLLTAASCGVAAAMHSQPLELGTLREFVGTKLCDGDSPQLVLRLGTVIQTAISVRRPLASVLAHGSAA
jgi:nitroreductase